MQVHFLKFHYFILLFLVSLAAVGAVLFTPALPSIQTYFQVSVGDAQFLMTIYLVGYTLGQLPYGPLANGLGRKKAAYLGLSIGILGTLLCIFSSPAKSFVLLSIGRFIQALGNASGLKISFTIIGDCFERKEATRRIAGFSISFAVLSACAVLVGGWITKYWGWVACFDFQFFYVLFLLALTFFLPETAKKIDPHVLKIKAILRDYEESFKSSTLLIGALIMGCTTSIIYAFATKSPFIGIEQMGLEPAQFGHYSLIPYMGMIVGSLISMKFSHQVAPLRMISIASIASFFCGLSMLLPFLWSIINIYSLFVSMIIILIPATIIFTNASAYAMSHVTNKSSASAVLNFINLGVASFAVLLVQLIYPKYPLVLPLIFYLFFVLMLIFYVFLREKKRGSK